MSFEDVRHYSRRAVVNRLDYSILRGMLLPLGIDLEGLQSEELTEATLLTMEGRLS